MGASFYRFKSDAMSSFFICVDPLKLSPISPILLLCLVSVLVCGMESCRCDDDDDDDDENDGTKTQHYTHKQQMLPAQQHLGSQDISFQVFQWETGERGVAAPLLLFCGFTAIAMMLAVFSLGIV